MILSSCLSLAASTAYSSTVVLDYKAFIRMDAECIIAFKDIVF